VVELEIDSGSPYRDEKKLEMRSLEKGGTIGDGANLRNSALCGGEE